MNTYESHSKDKKQTKEKKSSKKWIIIGVIVVIVIIIFASQSNSSDDSGSNGKSKSDSQSTSDRLAKLNEPVRDGKMEFIVKSINCDQSEVGTNEYVKTTTTGKFCVVDVSVKNISDKEQYVTSSEQKLYSEDKKEFGVDDEAQVYLGDQSLILEDINPDVTVEGKLVFDLPKDAVPSYIELHDNSFSNGVKVSFA